MKRITTLMMLMLTAIVGSVAQDMKVVDFKLLENDLTANRYETQKLDQNGERTALIKIVTPERGFAFDGGSLGVVATEEHTGEIWLYVPRRAQKLIIQHKDYGVLRDYFYPIPIEGGRTYEMLIDIGTGRYATITSSVAKADIFVDGEPCGMSPVRKYLNYGRHTVRAIRDRFEGETAVTITTNAEQQTSLVNVEMQDMSHLYGDVVVTVDNKANIYMNGQLMGTGEWRTQLREGNYTIETRKADSEPAMTSFTVTAQSNNIIKANAPIPHTGWLHVYTRPRNVKTSPFDVSEAITLPIGTYQMEFSKKGYVTQNREYTVRRNETTRDTVTLVHNTYVKPTAFYFGGGFTVRSLSGLTGIVGAIYQNHDLQASYTFGMKKSDAIYWNGDMNSAATYTMHSIGVKYGYQIPLMRQLAITPQVGYYYNFLISEGRATGDGTSAHSLSVGAKLLLVPMKHLYVFVAPEYMFGMSKSDIFKTITNATNVSIDGFAVHAGVLVSF